MSVQVAVLATKPVLAFAAVRVSGEVHLEKGGGGGGKMLINPPASVFSSVERRSSGREGRSGERGRRPGRTETNGGRGRGGEGREEKMDGTPDCH